MYNPYDFYFKKAKKEGFKARSAFKLEEIDKKYQIFSKSCKIVMDIGCSPGSWIQYAHKRFNEQNINDYKILGFDLKPTNLNLNGVFTYIQDITEIEKINEIINSLGISKFDLIMSDMAPNTIGLKDIDAIRSIGLLEKTICLYETFLKQNGKLIIKVFMGPGFDNFVKKIKSLVGGKGIKIFKPNSCRKESKETYIIKYIN